MINNQEFAKRLKKVIGFYDESASSFAEKIGVQRSSISHILSGRNKPSLDFVMKVLNAYAEVDLNWLVNGKGDFPKKDSRIKKQALSTETPSTSTTLLETSSSIATNSMKKNKPIETKMDNDSIIERIVIFYNNGTFKSYNP